MAGEQQSVAPPREVTAEDKALAADWHKRIEAALARPGIKEAHKQFENNRKLLRGKNKDGGTMQANLYFANLASMRPQVYAKDPEFACQPSAGVPPEQLKVVRKFCETAEAVLSEYLVKKTKLKKRAKRLLTSAYTTSVGWFKLCWQEDKEGVLITNQIKDIQDNLQRINLLQEQGKEAGTDVDLNKAKLEETLAGLQVQAERKVARGLTNDFVMSEDILILDDSVREITDYDRASAIAHRVWMSQDAFQARFKYKPSKGKLYSEQAGQMQSGTPDNKANLLCAWEIWDQDSNRVYSLCDGDEGFCDAPFSPDWTGERWYPFFLAVFNEIEGALYPLSDIELTTPQIEEINTTARDFRRDRKASLPLNIARKGGTLTDDDLKRIKDREGSDIIMVEGVGGQPISNDVWSGQLAQIKPENYDTTQARQFMEQIIGGGDAARGSVLKAKTATEAEILSQGLRSRSSERQDVIEDLLSEMGVYALQILLRKLSVEEVRKVAGPQAPWPQMSAEQVFDQITVEVRGGSTGKPDRLQEQDRWTKLLPVIEKTVEQVSQLRQQGQMKLAEALTELLRETLRRFDERLDIDQFLPPPPEDGQISPEQLQQENNQLKQQVQAMQAEGSDMKNKLDKGYITAAAAVATSLNPLAGAQAFGGVLQTLETGQVQPGVPMGPAPIDPAAHAQVQQENAGLKQQLAQKEGDQQVEIHKATINAQKEIEATKIKAPIEASAKVETARIQAEASQRAKEMELHHATTMAEKETADKAKPDHRDEMLKSLTESHKQLHEAVTKKPAMKVVHKRDPKTNRIIESAMVPAEQA